MSIQNANRERAKMIVSLFPGIHLRKLQKLLGTSFSTARYHVDGLARDGEIVCSRDGRYQRLYPAGTADGSKAAYAVLQSETARKVLRALARREGEMRNGDLCDLVRLPRSTVSECTALLTKAGLVARRVTMDGHTIYGIQERDKTLQLLAVFDRNMLDVATDRFTELWDF